jgi:hypothetical protein
MHALLYDLSMLYSCLVSCLYEFVYEPLSLIRLCGASLIRVRGLSLQSCEHSDSNLTEAITSNGCIDFYHTSEMGATDVILKGLNKKFIDGKSLEDTWNFVKSCEPIMLHKRGNEIKSQPKLTYGIANESGEYPLFRWGFDKCDWANIQAMPPQFLSIIDDIDKKFGVRTTHCLANYYVDGGKYVPVHQDQAFSPECKGLESEESVFIIGLGADRPLCFTPVTELGKKQRDNMDVITEVRLEPGDLYHLTGSVNSNFAHGVPEDANVSDLRVSLTFRRVTHSWVHPEQGYYKDPNGKIHDLAAQSASLELQPAAKKQKVEEAKDQLL